MDGCVMGFHSGRQLDGVNNLKALQGKEKRHERLRGVIQKAF